MRFRIGLVLAVGHWGFWGCAVRSEGARMIYPTTLSSALRTSPNLSSPLYRRWFPGAGQRGGGFAGFADYRGFSGLGQMCADGSYPQDDGTCADGSSPTYETDQYGATCQVTSMVGGNCPGSAPVTPVTSPIPTTLPTDTGSTTLSYPGMPALPSSTTGLCPDGSPPWDDGSCVTCSDGSVPWSDGSCGPAPLASGAVKLTPGTASPAAAAAAVIAAALSKAIAPTVGAGGVTSCPAGYIYGAPGASVQLSPGVSTVGTGKCLPVASTSIIPGITNSSLVTFGVILVGSFIFVQLVSRKKR